VKKGMYCEWARWVPFRVVLVVEAGCVDRISLRFFGKERGNAPLIIYHPLMDSQLNFINLLLTDLKLKTEIEDSYKEAEMFIIALFRKPTLKYDGSDEQRPCRPH
jgi:hypothetical protein